MHPTSRGRRVLAAVLYLGCAASAGAVVYPLVAPWPAAVATTVPAPDEPAFAPVVLPADQWAIGPGDPTDPDWKRAAREAVGGLALPNDPTGRFLVPAPGGTDR